MTHAWNANIYSQFIDFRTRPAGDLLAAIPNTFHPKTVYDLGCGPGNSTILLKNRWTEAKIVGLDSSVDMLNEAKTLYTEIHFIEGDIAHFEPKEKIDCLFANASLQWVDQHEKIIPKLCQFLNVGGILAVQMPNNFHSPMHQITLEILQSNKNWQSYIKR